MAAIHRSGRWCARGGYPHGPSLEALEARAMFYSDLSVAAVALDAPGATYHPGERVDAAVTVRTVGLPDWWTNTSTVVRAVLSRDQVWGNADDLPAGSFTLQDSYADDFVDGLVPIPGNWLALPATLKNPANTGDYHLGVQVDADGQLAETDEANNVGWSSQTIHLDAERAVLPHLTITGRGLEILNGDMAAGVSDNTAFGTVNGNARASNRVFRLGNTGDGVLHFSSVTISGRNPNDFTIVSGPGSDSEQAPGSHATLRIRFDPAGARLRKAVVKIRTNDPDNPVYRFGISGWAVNPARMTVRRISDPEYLAYRILNTGGRTLKVEASVSDAGAFIYHYTLEVPPPSRIPPGSSGVLKIFKGIAQVKTLSLYSNADEKNYVRIDLP